MNGNWTLAKIGFGAVGLLGLALFGLFLVACGPSPTPVPTSPPCPTAAPCPTQAPVEVPKPAVEVPFEARWAASGHADAQAEAFTHWDEATPKEIPVACAKCHSTPGYLDFLGADGSAAGKVDQAAPVGTVITCVACHNDVTARLTSVVFPSGAEIHNLGPEARCMECHQGRASTPTVNQAIADAGLTDDDTVSDKLGFTNIHYFAAAATQYGTLVQGGYQYPGKSYDAKAAHVAGFDTCVGCHDPHTLEVRVEACATCHQGVTTAEDLAKIRMEGSNVDYDGDGNLDEGIADEIAGLQELLYQAIRAYASEVAKTPIVYNPQAYPYFFADANGNGALDEGETAYKAWTGRLLKAAYNYQVSVKDPGAFAHGGKYVIELLYDSIESLNAKISTPIDLSQAHRIDAGHFAGSQETFRHWDEEGEVPGACARCHTGVGLPLFLKEGVNISEPPANGLLCSTCHNDLTTFTRYEVKSVKFPSGTTVDSGNPDMNLCLTCHQGRESTVSVNSAIKGLDDDTVSDQLRFRNIHYFAAGATLFGNQVQGAYQYTGQEYLGRFAHVSGVDTCMACHRTHGLTVRVSTCGNCHTGVKSPEDLEKIRMSPTDYDGDGDTAEGLAGEVETYREKLYAALRDYAQNVIGTAIVYNPEAYPYFFTDANGNGVADEGETAYATWTPRLLRAAYNYQYVVKDPGAFAHNGKYILQVLYDTLTDLGQKVSVDMTGMVRP